MWTRSRTWPRCRRTWTPRSAAGFHFHDLRFTGYQLAANAGATTRKLMHRMGHGSMRAALIYQHATTEKDRQIADALGALVGETRAEDAPDDGAAGALVPA